MFKIITRNFEEYIVRRWNLSGLPGGDFFGVSSSLLTWGRSRSLCKRENHERLIRYFGRIEEMEDRERI